VATRSARWQANVLNLAPAGLVAGRRRSWVAAYVLLGLAGLAIVLGATVIHGGAAAGVAGAAGSLIGVWGVQMVAALVVRPDMS
jgi:hypothetical protein